MSELNCYDWGALNAAQRDELLRRPAQRTDADVTAAVRTMMLRIRAAGDTALRDYEQKLDHVATDALELTAAERDAAEARVPRDLKDAMQRAYAHIAAFHRAQLPPPVTVETAPGLQCEVRTHPLDAVGLYVPGGTAPLFSTALMLAVPAQIARCPEIIMCSPPPIADPIVYAAALCGVRRIFRLGGAQAIIAMAYGTASVPRVLKIFGPGNQYVTAAKRLVAADPAGAAIDMPAGPSEVMVIADGGADPEYVAADLLSQAEHGPDSQVILVSTDEALINAAQAAVHRQLATLPRREIAARALTRSAAVKVAALDEAVAVAAAYAPEHLIVQTADPEALLPGIRNAGSVFLGAYTPEALGDYASGTNHTLPTYGYARTASALGTADYCRRFTVQRADRRALTDTAGTVCVMAEHEGLEGHARAVRLRVTAEGER